MTLAEFLDEAGLSYAAFAKMAGMESTSAAMNIYRYASGKRLPRPEVAQKIIKATKRKVTLKDIYGV